MVRVMRTSITSQIRRFICYNEMLPPNAFFAIIVLKRGVMVKCNICSKEFISMKSMTNHRRWHEIPVYQKFQVRFLKKFRVYLDKRDNSILKGINVGDKNGQWKGNKVSIEGVHDYVRSRFPRPKKCQCCGVGYPLDMANISQEYKRDVSDWEWLCRRCHMTKDGRMKNLSQFSGKILKRELHPNWNPNLTQYCKCCNKLLTRNHRRKIGRKDTESKHFNRLID